jgi:enamine deaminase RidA (YjgF/YER057c/UK114 family)
MGDRVFVGGILPIDEAGVAHLEPDIQSQTHVAFSALRRTLDSLGLAMSDLVRLNTYYMYQGPEDQATVFWEGMTHVRMQYLPSPGPAATAIRVAGTSLDGALLQVEAEALLPAARGKRIRIMPAASWDWSMPVSFSQGWQYGQDVWVGGQVCADKSGRALGIGDIGEQTGNVLEQIDYVLHDAGITLADLTHLKICYHHDGDHRSADARYAAILKLIGERLGGDVPPTTAIGVNLLYEGLLLEIDADAGAGSEQLGVASPAAGTGLLNDDVERSVEQLAGELAKAGGAWADVARLTVFMPQRFGGGQSRGTTRQVMDAIDARTGAESIPITTIFVQGLPGDANLSITMLKLKS